MSLYSLATGHVAREMATDAQRDQLSKASDDALGAKGEDVQNALSALVEYIPTETITLYIALLSSLPVLKKILPWLNAVWLYAAFAVLTPILFGLIFAGKRRARGESRWQGWRNWPWWLTIASSIAFLAWGVAVPGGLSLGGENGGMLGSLIAIVASTLLGVFGRFLASPAK